MDSKENYFNIKQITESFKNVKKYSQHSNTILDMFLDIIQKLDKSSKDYLSKVIPIDDDKQTLSQVDNIIIINYFKQIVIYLIKTKVELEEKTQLQESQSQYESLIQKLEADIRQHIRIEQQLRIYTETLQQKIDDFIIEREQQNQIIKEYEQQIKQKNKDIVIYQSEIRKVINSNQSKQQKLITEPILEDHQTIYQVNKLNLTNYTHHRKNSQLNDDKSAANNSKYHQQKNLNSTVTKTHQKKYQFERYLLQIMLRPKPLNNLHQFDNHVLYHIHIQKLKLKSVIGVTVKIANKCQKIKQNDFTLQNILYYIYQVNTIIFIEFQIKIGFSQINDVLRNETIYFRKSNLLRKATNSQNKLFRKGLIQDSLNDPTHPINSIIKNEDAFVPYLHERNSLGRLIKKPNLSSNREITNKQLVKSSLKLPRNQKICTFLQSEPPNSNRSYGQKTKTQSTADSFYSFFTFNKYNPNFLLKSKNSEPFSFKKSFYQKQL
ncbi:unnamed protein product [Paramecium sonneborni]|uniref:Uncharacterized protein n=1 Tax=Paramecium sonneborni TaxID=65129 RepID=A0A8S1KPA0_9CILI|nr:unnamed protein product [Paramecium sonneborni]